MTRNSRIGESADLLLEAKHTPLGVQLQAQLHDRVAVSSCKISKKESQYETNLVCSYCLLQPTAHTVTRYIVMEIHHISTW